jgi:cell division protein FtsL
MVSTIRHCLLTSQKLATILVIAVLANVTLRWSHTHRKLFVTWSQSLFSPKLLAQAWRHDVTDGVHRGFIRTILRETDTSKQEFRNLIRETHECRTKREITMLSLGRNETHIRILQSYEIPHKIQVTCHVIRRLQDFNGFFLVLFTVHINQHGSRLRYYATSRKVAGSIPDITGFFSIYTTLSATLWPWVRLSL